MSASLQKLRDTIVLGKSACLLQVTNILGHLFTTYNAANSSKNYDNANS